MHMPDIYIYTVCYCSLCFQINFTHQSIASRIYYTITMSHDSRRFLYFYRREVNNNVKCACLLLPRYPPAPPDSALASELIHAVIDRSHDLSLHAQQRRKRVPLGAVFLRFYFLNTEKHVSQLVSRLGVF
jgi:hypothetical protein